MSVWILAELEEGLPTGLTFELLSAGRALADSLGLSLGALMLGPGAAAFGPQLVRLGADRVAVAEPPSWPPEACLEIVAAALLSLDAAWVLAGHTRYGSELAARLAVRMEAGLMTACTALEVTDSAVTGVRSLPNGGTARVIVTTPCGLATLVPGGHPWPTEAPERTGEVLTLDLPPEAPARIRLLEPLSDR